MRRIAHTATLIDLLNLHRQDIFLGLNCHAIGTIKSFDPSNQTCSVAINYCRTYEDQNPDGSHFNRFLEYPLLLDCPVVVLRGGQSGLSLPIASGDQCLVLFNDRDIDNWFGGSKSGEVNSSRSHALADGIALVGLHPQDMSISSYDMTRAKLFFGDTEVGVSSSKIRIKNNLTTLNTLLGQLITTIQGITTTNAVVGAPCAISPASISALNTIATNIGGLLE